MPFRRGLYSQPPRLRDFPNIPTEIHPAEPTPKTPSLSPGAKTKSKYGGPTRPIRRPDPDSRPRRRPAGERTASRPARAPPPGPILREGPSTGSPSTETSSRPEADRSSPGEGRSSILADASPWPSRGWAMPGSVSARLRPYAAVNGGQEEVARGLHLRRRPFCPFPFLPLSLTKGSRAVRLYLLLKCMGGAGEGVMAGGVSGLGWLSPPVI